MSTLKVDTLQTTGGAGLYPAKAWVNYNGTGTIAIRADGNVSSLTDNGNGNYGINLSSSMQDANYGLALSVGNGDASTLGNLHTTLTTSAPTTSSFRQDATNGGSTTKADRKYMYAAVLR